jgi:GMP synthase-like glutamine amidotransferase
VPTRSDGAIVIGSQMTAQMEDSANMQVVANMIAAIYGGAVTGLMLQGESDPQTIARRAGEIVTAARAQMKKENGAVVVNVPNAVVDDPNTTEATVLDNTDRG